MPRSKDPRSYSREMGLTLQRAYLEGEVRLPDMPIKTARSRRSEFHCYIQAVRRYPEHAPASVEASWQVSMRLEGDFDGTGRADLVLYNKENTPTAIYLREALGLSKQSDEAKASVEVVLQKLEPSRPNPMETPFNYGEEGNEQAPAPKQSGIAQYLAKAKERKEQS